MSDARQHILNAVRRSLKATVEDAERRAAVEQRLAQHPRGPQPSRADKPHPEQIELFATMAREVSASVVRVADAAQVPQAVTDYLKAENLPAAVRLAPDPTLDALPWDGQPLLQVGQGRAEAADEVSVTQGFAGVAETGTLMLLSGAEGPTTLNFLPDTNIVVLEADRVVGRYEDGWDRLRETHGEGRLPRTVNFITGPSRTADIEQKLQLGAHGPRRLHIILVDRGRGDG